MSQQRFLFQQSVLFIDDQTHFENFIRKGLLNLPAEYEFCPSRFSRKIRTASLSFPSSTKTSGRCTKIRWLVSGLSMRSISVRTQKTGRSSLRTSSTSSNTYSRSSQLVMVLCLKTLRRDSAQRYKFQKPAAFTVSK